MDSRLYCADHMPAAADMLAALTKRNLILEPRVSGQCTLCGRMAVPGEFVWWLRVDELSTYWPAAGH